MMAMSAPGVQVREGEPMDEPKRLIRRQANCSDEHDAGKNLVGLQETLSFDYGVAQP
jgi:hypothetical protein